MLVRLAIVLVGYDNISLSINNPISRYQKWLTSSSTTFFRKTIPVKFGLNIIRISIAEKLKGHRETMDFDASIFKLLLQPPLEIVHQRGTIALMIRQTRRCTQLCLFRLFIVLEYRFKDRHHPGAFIREAICKQTELALAMRQTMTADECRLVRLIGCQGVGHDDGLASAASRFDNRAAKFSPAWRRPVA